MSKPDLIIIDDKVEVVDWDKLPVAIKRLLDEARIQSTDYHEGHIMDGYNRVYHRHNR